MGSYLSCFSEEFESNLYPTAHKTRQFSWYAFILGRTVHETFLNTQYFMAVTVASFEELIKKKVEELREISNLWAVLSSF